MSEDQKIALTPDEYAKLRNGSQGLKDWTRIAIIVGGAVIGLITYFNGTAFQTEANKQAIQKQDAWIEGHERTVDEMRKAISGVEMTQSVILEKITVVQRDVDKLANE